MPAHPISEIRDLDAHQIRRIVSKQFGATGAAGIDLTVAGPVAASTFSRIFRGEGGAFPKPVAIKLFLEQQFGESPYESARTYYDALAELREASTRDVDFGVVEPLGILEDYGIVVTEWIDGLTFSQWVRGASPDSAAQGARKAGIWLARLHGATGLLCQPMEIGPVLERLQASLHVNSHMAGSRSVRHATRLLRQAAGRVGAEDVIWARSHGDFKPANLVVRDERLFGIDLDLLCAAPTVHDAAHFLNHLHLLFLSLGGLRRLSEVPGLVDAFRSGYAEKGQTALPPLPLAWERLRNATHLLVRHREWSRPPRSWVANLMLRHLVRRLARDLTALLDKPDTALRETEPHEPYGLPECVASRAQAPHERIAQ